MKYVYTACFYKEDDGRYSVEVPDFPLAIFGDDLADAIYSVQVTRFRTVLRKRCVFPWARQHIILKNVQGALSMKTEDKPTRREFLKADG